MIKIIATTEIKEKHLTLLLQLGDIDIKTFKNINEAEKFLEETDVLVTYGDDLSSDVLEKAKNLKWIQVISAGLDKMPFDYLQSRGILVTNVRGMHQIPMAEHVMAGILSIGRSFPQIWDMQKAKIWDRSIHVDEIYGKTLTVVGAGSIGEAVAQRAKAFGMITEGVNTSGKEVEFFDRMYPREQLLEALSRGDFIVLITPLIPETYKLIGEKELRVMKKSSYLVNVARGAVVDEEILIQALKEKWIAGAFLDVFVEEPLPGDSPLWTLDNCIVIPHLGGKSSHYIERAIEIFKHNLEVFITKQGDMRNVIDLVRKY